MSRYGSPGADIGIARAMIRRHEAAHVGDPDWRRTATGADGGTLVYGKKGGRNFSESGDAPWLTYLQEFKVPAGTWPEPSSEWRLLCSISNRFTIARYGRDVVLCKFEKSANAGVTLGRWLRSDYSSVGFNVGMVRPGGAPPHGISAYSRYAWQLNPESPAEDGVMLSNRWDYYPLWFSGPPWDPRTSYVYGGDFGNYGDRNARHIQVVARSVENRFTGKLQMEGFLQYSGALDTQYSQYYPEWGYPRVDWWKSSEVLDLSADYESMGLHANDDYMWDRRGWKLVSYAGYGVFEFAGKYAYNVLDAMRESITPRYIDCAEKDRPLMLAVVATMGEFPYKTIRDNERMGRAPCYFSPCRRSISFLRFGTVGLSSVFFNFLYDQNTGKTFRFRSKRGLVFADAAWNKGIIIANVYEGLGNALYPGELMKPDGECRNGYPGYDGGWMVKISVIGGPISNDAPGDPIYDVKIESVYDKPSGKTDWKGVALRADPFIEDEAIISYQEINDPIFYQTKNDMAVTGLRKVAIPDCMLVPDPSHAWPWPQ